MKKIFSLFAAFLFAVNMTAADPVEIMAGTFDGKAGNYTEGWTSTGTGKTRNDCVIVGAGENITSPSIDLSQYESISIAIKARRFGTLTGSKATITATFDGEVIGTTNASGTSATTSLAAIEYTVGEGLSTGTFVFTCSNATSAGSTHGAGINSIVITGVKKASQGGGEGGETTSTTKTVYCKAAQDWWKTDGAAVGVYAFADGNVKNAEWPGVRMTAVEGETDLWKADIDTAKYEKIIFVRVNGTGDLADWGAQTEDLAVPADKDLYTITSTSAQWSGEGNKVTGAWSVYGAQGGDDPVVEEPAVIKMHGNFTGDWANTDAFTLSEDKKTATLKLTLNKGNYEFGMRIGADDNWTSNGVAFTRENKSAAVAAGQGNLTLAADTKGDYTFTWTYATNTLAIDFPEYVETLPEMQIAGAWNVENEAWVKNAMTPAEDKKTASYEVELKAGDYEFKVIKDSKWLAKANEGNAYGLHRGWTGVAGVVDQNTSENLKLTADVDGKYTFVWTFANDSLGVVFPEYVETLSEMQIAGAWNVENEAWVKNTMTPAEDKKTASYEVELKAGDYEFKVIKDSKWLAKANEGNAYGLHRGWTGVAGVVDQNTSENLKLTADVDGKYTFVWTFANDSLGVVFPEKPAEPAAAVVLPATLDVTNVSFRSEGMPDFVVEEGQDYAGTYFDMGAHDSSNDTLLYAEWNVTIQPIKYNVAVDVYNTNSWSVQLYLLNQAGDTLKSLRYKGSSGQKGQFAIGALDLSDLEAGDYKVRARAATAWSAMKLKDVIFTADYKGVSVELPGTLQPAYAELSSGASVANDAIAFKPSTANNEYATWNVSFAKAGKYNVTIDMTATNGHTYGVALLSADGAEQIGAVAEAQAWDTGVKELGAITVPAAGKYVVKLTNATQWSEAVLNSITFAAAAAEPEYYLVGSMTEWAVVADEAHTFAVNPENDAEYMLNFTLAENDAFKVMKVEGESQTWYPEGMDNNYTVDAAHAGEKTIYFRPDGQGGEGWHYGVIYVAANEEPVVVELQAVSEATTWDFSKITANTENALYNKEGIQLTAESTPNKNEEVVYANYSADFMTFAEGFDATTMAFQGEYPIRKNQYCQAGTLHFKTTVAGTITVKFSDTGSSASATAVKRYLVVNGEQTEYWTSRENNGEEPYEAQLNVTSGEIAVPAGDVTITGSSAIVMYNVTFTPKVEEPAKFYITGDSALVVNAGLDKAKAWNPDAIKSTETSYKLNLAAGDYKLKVTVDGTWETAKGYDALTTIAEGLTADADGNICFTLTEAGAVNVHYDGEFFFLNGNFYVAPVVVKYYLKNNWDGGEWTWKEMVAQSDGSYQLENVVFGGTGVNINTSASDEGSRYVAAENIPTMDMTIFDMGTLGALDTVAFVYTPSEYNSYNPDEESGLSAYITGKYVPGETPQPVAHTYTVAGNLTDAFGTSWDPENAANDMVKQEDGTYKWEKAELALAAGTVQFKVCEDHAWDVAYPASDYQLAIAEAGEYTITITFNPETKAVNAVATKTGDAVVTVNYYLVGSVKGWEAKAENIFTLNAEAGEGIEEYVIETTLEVGEGLKVLSSTGTWYPEGMGNEYVVDQNHAGTTTIYFRPAGNAEWAAFGGFMYVVPTGTVGFDNTAVDAKAVKVLRDGQVIIIRGEHEYTTMGQMIK